ncbi:MAG: EF-Tu/IF-2/RF-3 family GTPase [Candidatus Kariarchaeaceae archaeon]
MKSLTLFGSSGIGKTSLARQLGSQGTQSDFTLFNYTKGQTQLVIADSHRYPEKMDSAAEAATLADYAILMIPPEGLDAFGGESVLLIDSLKIKQGIIAVSKLDQIGEIDSIKYKYTNMLKNTVLANYEWIGISINDGSTVTALREKIIKTSDTYEGLEDEDLRVEVDHSFPVSGIGTVILGRMKAGKVKKGQTVIVQPGNHKCIVRGIQRQDVDVHEAIAGDRVGLALRGLLPKHVKRGSQVSENGQLTETQTLTAIVDISAFSQPLTVGQQVHVSIALQTKSAKVTEIKGKKMVFTTNDPFVLTEKMRGVILDYDQKNRVIGGFNPINL